MPKQIQNNNVNVFLALVKAGLWEQDTRLSSYEPFAFNEVCLIAQEQALMGLLTAGIEHVDGRLPQTDTLKILGETLMLEQQYCDEFFHQCSF